MTRWGLTSTFLVGLGAMAASSCSPADFESETVVDTVRILASRANEPKAKPGDMVTVEVLAVDGRTSQPEKMDVSWLTYRCENPANDAYYACFPMFAEALAALGAGGDGGAPLADAGLALGKTGPVDLTGTPLLQEGTSYSFTMPSDIIIPRTGVSPSYGLVMLFNFACAGHIELLPYDPTSQNPQQIPIGCFDAQHNQLGPSDFVFGLTRVYAYDQPNEVNPVISSVDFGGTQVDVDGGTAVTPFTVPLCTASDAKKCTQYAIGPIVPPSVPSTKQVWADFYSTTGTFGSDARLLYDPSVSLSIPSGTDNKFTAPPNLLRAPAQNFVWIVVHDDQGGADWVTVPLTLQ
jgi:hypothetical protein